MITQADRDLLAALAAPPLTTFHLACDGGLHRVTRWEQNPKHYVVDYWSITGKWEREPDFDTPLGEMIPVYPEYAEIIMERGYPE